MSSTSNGWMSAASASCRRVEFQQLLEETLISAILLPGTRGSLTRRCLQGPALVVLDVAEAKHAEHCHAFRGAEVEQVVHKVLPVQQALVVGDGVWQPLGALEQSPAARRQPQDAAPGQGFQRSPILFASAGAETQCHQTAFRPNYNSSRHNRRPPAKIRKSEG